MLNKFPAKVMVSESSVEEVKQLLNGCDYISGIGHQSTAQLLTKMLQLPIETNRIQISLEPGDKLVVFQLLLRLQEGVVLDEIELQKIPFKFYVVSVE
jgi:hypothetical protein